MPAEVAIRALGRADEAALTALFVSVSDDEATNRFFRPFPMTAEQAALITSELTATGDLYYGAFDGDELLGLGMLRGWSEGFENPAFGVVVAPSARGRGVASKLIEWGAQAAREHGAREILLKVHDENVVARRAYERAGFWFSGERAENGQLIGRLGLPETGEE